MVEFNSFNSWYLILEKSYFIDSNLNFNVSPISNIVFLILLSDEDMLFVRLKQFKPITLI